MRGGETSRAMGCPGAGVQNDAWRGVLATLLDVWEGVGGD